MDKVLDNNVYGSIGEYIKENAKGDSTINTKGTEDINQLRGSEKGKIKCGKLHFEVIDTGIKYEVVKELKTLKGMWYENWFTLSYKSYKNRW